MKNVLAFTAIMISAGAMAQNQPARSNTIMTPVSTIQPAIQQVQIVKPNQMIKPPAGQPDLKFTDFNVRIIDSSVVNGVKMCHMNITYSITNCGTAPIATDNIIIQKYTCSQYWITRTQDLRLTGVFTVAGGGVMSTGGKSLAPGATISENETYGLNFPTAPNPVMLITINVPDNLNEKDKTNNSTYKTILL